MEATTAFQLERAEMEAILSSGVFDKAPRLSHFFRYVCERHFEGLDERIKEYTIATEALGRPADFDPKKDSIVRVEAHRLRKRLQEFYEGPGVDRTLRVFIPSGQYRPQFLPAAIVPPLVDEALRAFEAVECHEAASTAPTSTITEETENPPDFVPAAAPPPDLKELPRTPVRTGLASPNWKWAAVAIAILLLTAGVFFLSYGRNPKRHSSPKPNGSVAPSPASAQPVASPVTLDDTDAIRILAGYEGPSFRDIQGRIWTADRFFSGGDSKPLAGERYIEGQPDPHLLHSERTGTFWYDIPVPPGSYELHLLFAETDYGPGNPAGGGEATRLFNIKANDTDLLANFDPLGEVGSPNRLDERVFRNLHPSAKDGKIHLSFRPGESPAFLNALSVIRTPSNHPQPVRLVLGQRTIVEDKKGQTWLPDAYSLGGTGVKRLPTAITGTDNQNLFGGERYGNFSYRIPLATGRYRLNLFFAEQWFGNKLSLFAPVASRAFSVYANHELLLRNFSPGTATGGPNHATCQSFSNISPNPAGQLLLEFVPLKNYAELNAIELIPLP